MDGIVDKAAHPGDFPEEHFQQIDAVPSHINQGPASAGGRVLAPRPFDGRIPARKLGACIGRRSKLTFADELERFSVLSNKTHHKGTAELNTGPFAKLNHFFRLGNRHTERLFTQNMLPGSSAGANLLRMKTGGRGNIHGIDIRIQQLFNTRRLFGAKLFCCLSIHLLINIEDCGQFGITGF